MAAPTNTISVFAPNAMKIVKMKLKKGQQVSKGTIVCLYTSGTNVTQKFKSNDCGIVAEILTKEGEDVDKGCVVFTVQGCSHPTVMKDMCADCGADLRIENSTAGNRKEEVSASVAMVHSIPELIVSEELAKELGKADEERLLKTRKLVLLVDLDQTLIHTTNDNIPPNLKDVHHYQLWHGNQLLWYHTRLRPHTETFLKNISQLYELHICTFGSRIYAHTIAKILDPEGKYFSHRILSRDECFNAQAKTANLKALFPCGDAMVCIIDDREDVWHFSPNLVHVKPYRLFQGTADINAPPGLTKTEHDSETLVHRVRKVSQSSTGSNDEKTAQSNTGSSDEKPEVAQSNTGSNDEKAAQSNTGNNDEKLEVAKSSTRSNNEKAAQSNTGSNDEKPEVAQSSTGSNDEKAAQSNTGSNDEKPEVAQSSTGSNDEKAAQSNTGSNDEKPEVAQSSTGSNDKKAAQSNTGSNDEKPEVAQSCTENIDEKPEGTHSSTGSKIEKLEEGPKSEADQQTSSETEKSETAENGKDEKSDMGKNEMETDDLSNQKVEKDKETEDARSKEEIEHGNETGVEELKSSEGENSINKIVDKNEEENKIETSVMKSESDVEAEKCSRNDESKTDGDGNKEADKMEIGSKDEEVEMIEWDDDDDYLFYLEEILKIVHSAFYNFYDQIKGKGSEEKKGQEKAEKPSLKNLIPYIKKKALKGCNILFSGVIPTNMAAEKSRAYIVAKALGANVHTEFKTKYNEKDPKEYTTHLVASRPGTSKVRTAVKYKHVKKVNPDWLWSCSERWERVEESLFPIPPASDSDDQGRDSPDISKLQKNTKRKRPEETGKETNESDSKRIRKVNSSNELDNGSGDTKTTEDNSAEKDKEKQNGSGEKPKKRNFSMSYNPMLAFSDDDLAYMDKEVEDEMDDEDESSEDEEVRDTRIRKQVLKHVGNPDDSSSSEDSLCGNTPRGWGLKKKMSPKSSSEDELKGSSSPVHELGPEYESETDQDKFEKIMDAFGPETENSDDEYAESIGSVDEEIAEAVMKEFLSRISVMREKYMERCNIWLDQCWHIRYAVKIQLWN
ncbi:RNA polymerase II subunit A C-terminal domain phosphatase-like [Mercenaria mercenaria]|uniref:RNA polymerase II subunit A C-terminal domain phosphatase-like n=1 Tax=Mercenaria mercenaria TaxID=6596 RepID=UPI00234E8CFE|nr:RNA polymerase II subunit A C-terminal domain phosphatase-like [Mercenaria mercenaria]